MKKRKVRDLFMATRRSFRCPHCGVILEMKTMMQDTTLPYCQNCEQRMQRFFGDMMPGDMLINYGYREGHYGSVEEENIAKFQFTNL
jgi:hypothetical protein